MSLRIEFFLVVGLYLFFTAGLVPLLIINKNIEARHPKISSRFIIGLQLVYSLFSNKLKLNSINNFNVFYFLDRNRFLGFLERLITVVRERIVPNNKISFLPNCQDTRWFFVKESSSLACLSNYLLAILQHHNLIKYIRTMPITIIFLTFPNYTQIITNTQPQTHHNPQPN